MFDRTAQQHRLNTEWSTHPRWRGIQRPYSAADVVRLRGTVHIEHSLALLGAEKFWTLLHEESVVGGLGCVTGNQAVQAVQSGLKAIYCSGWQVAGDGNSAGEMYPDQSLYPVDSVPKMIERINNALLRTDQIHALDGAQRHRLARTDHRRCRSRLRRQPQCLRTHQGDDSCWRGRRALRGPALLREKVRAHGRQGAGAHRRSHQQAGGGTPGRRRVRSANHRNCAHRRGGREPSDFRSRFARPAVPDRKAERRRVFPCEERHRTGDCPRP